MNTPEQTEWTIPQSEPITDVARLLARDWIAHGFISVGHPATGRGSKNKLTIKDLYKIKTFDFLMKNHVVRKDAKQIVAAFDNYTAREPFLHVFRTGDKLEIKWLSKIVRSVLEADILIIIDTRKITKTINMKVLPVRVITE